MDLYSIAALSSSKEATLSCNAIAAARANAAVDMHAGFIAGQGAVGANPVAAAAVDAAGNDPMNLKLLCDALGIMAPCAGKRATLEEDRCSKSGAVLAGHTLNIEIADFCHINTDGNFPLR